MSAAIAEAMPSREKEKNSIPGHHTQRQAHNAKQGIRIHKIKAVVERSASKSFNMCFLLLMVLIIRAGVEKAEESA